MPAAVTQSRRDYVNVRGFGALTVALVGRSRAIVLLPVGGREGINQHGELAVVEQAQRAEQPTAGRDLFPLYARSAARNDCESLTGAHSAEGRVSLWSCHKWSSEGRFVPRRTEPSLLNGASAERRWLDRFFLVASIRKPMCLVTIGPNYHYRLLL